MKTRLWLAFAPAAFLCLLSPARASDCAYPTASIVGNSQCFPTMMLVDPATGRPVSPVGGSSNGTSGSGAVYGNDATGAAPTKPPVFVAGVDPSGFVRPIFVSSTGVVSVADALLEAAAGTPSDAAATVSGGAVGNGSEIAQLKASVNQLAAIVAKLNASIAVTGQFYQTTQPVSIPGTLPAFASTPTFNIGSGLPASYPDATADAVLGTTGDSAYAGSGSASLNALLKGLYNAGIAATPAGANLIGKVGIDQTTHGTTDKTAADLFVGGAANSTTNRAFTTGNDTLQPGANLVGQTAVASYSPLYSNTPLAANATYNSGLLQSPLAATNPTAYAYLTVMLYADQAGTYFVDYTLDNNNFYPLNGLAGTAYTASSSVSFKTSIPSQYIRVRFTNGATAQTKFGFSYLYSGS